MNFLKIRIQFIFLLGRWRRFLTGNLRASISDLPDLFLFGKILEVGASTHKYPFGMHKKIFYTVGLGFSGNTKSNRLIEIKPPKYLIPVTCEKFDSIYASHVLEHTPNPLSAIDNYVETLKEGGRLYLRVPNKELTYDKFRKTTSFDYLIERYINKEYTFNMDSIREMVEETENGTVYGENLTSEQILLIARHILENPDGTHHYFVFDIALILKLIDWVCINFHMKKIFFCSVNHEFHFCLQKV
jgi:hypothetical protein